MAKFFLIRQCKKAVQMEVLKKQMEVLKKQPPFSIHRCYFKRYVPSSNHKQFDQIDYSPGNAPNNSG